MNATGTRFRVVIADPPWEYRVAGVQGDVSEQYPTMNLSALRGLPVSSWCADDAVLAMWGTWPKLDEGVDLVRAWGFDYVTGFPWIKTVGVSIRRGIGFWTQQCSEAVLIGRRGTPTRDRKPAPALGLLAGTDRQFWAPGGAPGSHSRKPYGLHEWLAAQFDGPYLEIFARRPHAGWTTWGGDLGFRLSAEGVERVDPLPDATTQRGLFDGDAA